MPPTGPFAYADLLESMERLNSNQEALSSVLAGLLDKVNLMSSSPQLIPLTHLHSHPQPPLQYALHLGFITPRSHIKTPFTTIPIIPLNPPNCNLPPLMVLDPWTGCFRQISSFNVIKHLLSRSWIWSLST